MCVCCHWQELERLRESLEEVESSTVAQQDIRTQRENELAALKKTLEDEVAAHEEAIAAMRSKHSKAVEELNEQLESAKKVSLAIETMCVNIGRSFRKSAILQNCM